MGAEVEPAKSALPLRAITRFVPLSNGRALLDTTDGTVLWDGHTASRIGEPGELGSSTGAYSWSDSAALIARGRTIVLFQDGALSSTVVPIDGDITSIAAARNGADAWLGTRDQLWLSHAGTVRSIRLGDTPIRNVSVAAAEGDAAWVVASGRLFHVGLDDQQEVVARLYAQPSDILSLASDRSGQPYVVADGTLHTIDDLGRLLAFDLGSPAHSVTATGQSRDLWVAAEASAFFVEGLTAYPIMGVSGTLLPGSAGEAFSIVAGSATRIRVRRRVEVPGLPDGARIVDRAELPIDVEDASSAVVSARIDGRDIPMSDGMLRIDPAELTTGEHHLVLDASWSDGTLPASLEVRFMVAADVTWSGDVQKLFLAECAACHGPAGPSPTRLDSPDLWKANWPRILDNLGAGRMPLGRPALRASDIELLSMWAESGFRD